MNTSPVKSAAASPATLPSGAPPTARALNSSPAVPFAALLQKVTGIAPPAGAPGMLPPSGALVPAAPVRLGGAAFGALGPKGLGASADASTPAVGGRGALALGPRDEPTDPIHRQHASLIAPDTMLFGAMSAPVATDAAKSAPAAAARASLEELLPALVRKIAWSGDGKRGSVRLEIGAGALAGATLVVHADEGRVRVHLTAPSGADGEAWGRRIRERLAARNVHLE